MSDFLDLEGAERPVRWRCACGLNHSAAEHVAPSAPASVPEGRPAPAGVATRAAAAVPAAPAPVASRPDAEAVSNAFIEASLFKAVFPHAATRRHFLRAVGRDTARAALASVLPLGSLQAMAQERGALEKSKVKVGFIPITCATPLIMAHPLGLYRNQGLEVELVRTPGWGVVRERMLKGEYDASHFLSPMPLAMTLGLGTPAKPMNVATIQNINGQAITLSQRLRNQRDPKTWRGLKLGIPFEHSMHNFLLRYYLAEAGLHPDRDVQLVVVPPPEMVNQLKAGMIDGFLGPDPFNQRAVFEGVGFIHMLSKQIWDGHPCCAFGVSDAFAHQAPNTFAALYRAIINSSMMASLPQNREQIARAIAPAPYLNQPLEVVMDVLVGKFDDGLGNVRTMPDRASFDPVPWQSMAVWMLTQMKRWGYLKAEVNYRQIAEQVFLFTDAKKQMSQAGWRPPESGYRKFKVMGKEFDPAKPEEYLRSFAIATA